MTKYRSCRVDLIIRCIVNPDQFMPNCLDSVIHVMRDHLYIGGQGIWMLISYLFKFIIAFFLYETTNNEWKGQHECCSGS